MYVPLVDPPLSPHQADHFALHKDTTAWGLLWEQGTRKTRTTIDTFCHQYIEGRINAVVVLAPPGVHENWVVEQMVKWVPDDLKKQIRSYVFYTGKAKRKSEKFPQRQLIDHNGLSVLAITYNGLMTEHGRKLVKQLLKKRRCMLIADEGHRLCRPKAKWTIRALSMTRYSESRRVLTGTLLRNGEPFDAYAPIKFLDPDFWSREIDIHDYAAFKNYFGTWVSQELKDGGSYERCVEYKNLDKLQELLKKISDRVEMGVVLGEVPKPYPETFHFDMTPQQRRLYDDLRNDYISFLESGESVTADMAMTRMLRLQQVTCGYVPVDSVTDDPQPTLWISDKNPRLELLLDRLKDEQYQSIIFSRFRKDIDWIMEKLGDKAVRYDGKVPHSERGAAQRRFTRGDAQWLVGNPALAAEGLNLQNARSIYFYANSFKLTERTQGISRAYRSGQKYPVKVTDFIARKSVDEGIVTKLRKKMEISASILGDQWRTWL